MKASRRKRIQLKKSRPMTERYHAVLIERAEHEQRLAEAEKRLKQKRNRQRGYIKGQISLLENKNQTNERRIRAMKNLMRIMEETYATGEKPPIYDRLNLLYRDINTFNYSDKYTKQRLNNLTNALEKSPTISEYRNAGKEARPVYSNFTQIVDILIRDYSYMSDEAVDAARSYRDDGSAFTKAGSSSDGQKLAELADEYWQTGRDLAGEDPEDIAIEEAEIKSGTYDYTRRPERAKRWENSMHSIRR